ncbi:MAG: nitroreductase family protein [Proteobacteria bacterium]|nr:nitroreductase family protein [Pseudomonadota bacterium]
MKLLQIDENTCDQDGLCAAICPAGLIGFSPGQFPESVADAEDVCIRCGHCVAVCPSGSLSHREMAAALCPPVRKELLPTAEQCEHFLRNRRSIRNFKQESISREELQRLIEVARYAPSGHNSQGVKWLVLGNRDDLHRLAGIVADWMRVMLERMPEFARSLFMDKTLARWDQGIDGILRNAPTLVITFAEKDDRMAQTTCTIALSHLELTATAMGLGCCWAGFFNAAASNFLPLREALALPVDQQVFGAMMVGHPRFEYHRLPLRTPPGNFLATLKESNSTRKNQVSA